MKVKQIRHSLVSKVIRKTAVTVKPNENKAPGTARQVETKHLGWGNPWYQYRLGHEGTERGPVEKDLWILVDERLDFGPGPAWLPCIGCII